VRGEDFEILLNEASTDPRIYRLWDCEMEFARQYRGLHSHDPSYEEIIAGISSHPPRLPRLHHLQPRRRSRKDIQTIFISRFFDGVFGSCAFAVVAAVFAEILDNTKRGLAIAVFSAVVSMEPFLAPFIREFIAAMLCN
jgi:predicted outer membrane lipoprotein